MFTLYKVWTSGEQVLLCRGEARAETPRARAQLSDAGGIVALQELVVQIGLLFSSLLSKTAELER